MKKAYLVEGEPSPDEFKRLKKSLTEAGWEVHVYPPKSIPSPEPSSPFVNYEVKDWEHATPDDFDTPYTPTVRKD